MEPTPGGFRETAVSPGNPDSFLLSLVAEAADGFVPSIVAIGLIRTWLSLQTGISSAYATSYVDVFGLDGWQQGALIAACLVMCFFPARLEALRRAPVVWPMLGALGCAAYVAGVALAEPLPVVGIVGAVVDIALFAFSIRVWYEDNCTSRLDAILVRLGLSFAVQYIAYSLVLVLPEVAQRTCTAGMPPLIMVLLASRPRPYRDVPQPVFSIERGSLGAREALSLVLVVLSSIAAHALIFSSSVKVTGVWIVGPLFAMAVCVSAPYLFRRAGLFKGCVAVALFVQCFAVVLVMAFPGSMEWVSLAKTMSYAVSMMLTLSIGCYVGPLSVAPGRAAFRWMAMYLAAFYLIHNAARAVFPNSSATLAMVLLLLSFAAVVMLMTDWTGMIGASGPDDDVCQVGFADGQGVADPCLALALRHGLTQRERRVLALLLEELPVKELAARENVSVNTVRSQVQAVYRKLGVHSRSELLAKALCPDEVNEA